MNAKHTPEEEEQGRIAREILLEKGKLSCEEMPVAKHTPTPWELPNGEDKNKFGTYRIGEKPYNGGSAAHLTNIALVGSLEDAAFIVHAVNSHEALLEAAKRARESLHNFLSDGRESPYESSEIDELDRAIAQAGVRP